MVSQRTEAVYQQLHSALNLLLWSDITVVTALSLSAVDGLWWKTSIALSADHFLALELSGESSKSWLNLDGTHTSASESENQMEGRLLLDVVVGKGSSILKLFTSEDESLLIWWDALLILNFGFDILDRVGWLHVESNRLTREGFDKNLHNK